MKKVLHKLLLASSISLVLAVTGASAMEKTVSNEINNARQESQIETSYALSPYLRQHQIAIAVFDGTATLSGLVDEEIYKELAEQIALGVPGIESVKNEITIQPDYEPITRTEGERSFGDLVDDVSITAAVKSKLMWSAFSDGIDTEVSTSLAIVTLAGTAESDEKKALAEMLAMNTRGVKAVDNQLVIDTEKKSAPESTGESNGASQNISDTWITTKVKSTFLMSNNIHSRDISVTTEKGIVTLTGETHSGIEHALAVELAQNIKGVKSVHAKALTF
ncbi:BON domain-containing protein [Nitrincola schmidtii]|uniref:BON domain-containing protein n=1 Tax=Nitrincola schmidtii TaxID=1730894 RepID=UPI00124D80F1|nr:BON domain-containing protein [Nitrincola schmidtii]